MEVNKRVKLMKRKITIMLCICICILGLTACQTDPKDVDYNGMTYQQLEEYAQKTWEGIQVMEPEQVEAAVKQIEEMPEATRRRVYDANEGMEDQMTLMKSWLEVSRQAGAFVSIDSFNVTMTGKTTTTELLMEFEKRPVVLSVVYQNRDMTVETVTIDLVYSLGEKLQKALMNTVMGMATVFIMLIIICLLISCFAVIPKIQQKQKAKKEQSRDVAKEEPQAAASPFEFLSEEPKTDDLELVAVISAAIAAYSGQSEDDFIVRSIRRR